MHKFHRLTALALILPALCLFAATSALAQDEPAAAAPDPFSAAATAALSLVDTNSPFYTLAANVTGGNSLGIDPLNNQLFQARFEKYLNAPAATGQEDQEYHKIIQTLMDALSAQHVNSQRVSASFRLLPRASNYTIDANLCDGIANSVYAVWQAQRNLEGLTRARADLEEERKRLEWNRKMEAEKRGLRTNDSGYAERMLPYNERLTELNGLRLRNTAKQELSEIQSKLEFQAFLMQMFFQRRFQHVLISTRFYRHLFGDGDTALSLEGASKTFFDQGTGLPPTVTTLDSISNEIIRDVAEGVEAYRYLLDQNERAAATRQLAQAFALGEYLPPIRLLPREDKRRILDFTRASGRLQSAMKARDFDLAESLAHDLQKLAADADLAEALALIQTARAGSNLHLAKARNAAMAGDMDAVETALKAATELWPLNPNLKSLTSEVFDTSDVRFQALKDLDRLLDEKNYRRIMEDQFRFIAAVAGDTNRQERLSGVLQDLQSIEAAIARSQEFAKRGDPIGAWENAELAYQDHPEDGKLNELRANLSADAAEFAQVIRKAKALETSEEDAAGLAWYLKAQRLYPPSQMARMGIDRLVARLLPETTPTAEPEPGQEMEAE